METQATPPRPFELIKAAQDCAEEFGWQILPLEPGGEAPITPDGIQNATSSQSRLGRFWTEQKDANVGVATGRRSGLVVLVAGEETLAALEAERGGLVTLRAGAPSGAVLLFFAAPDCLVGGKEELFPGVAVRGEDGFVPIPPTWVGGGRYEWQNDEDLAPLPGWLLAKLEEAGCTRPLPEVAPPAADSDEERAARERVRRRVATQPPEPRRPDAVPARPRRIGPAGMSGFAPFSPELCQFFGWRLVPVGGETEAVATGQAAGLVAVVSRGEAGRRTLAHLRKTHGSFATTSVLPAVGAHDFFVFLAAEEALPSRKELAPGLDFLGEGGHFVPGSGATVYHGGGRPPAPLPAWLADLAAGRAAYEPPPQPEPPPSLPPKPPLFPQSAAALTAPQQANQNPPRSVEETAVGQMGRAALHYAEKGWLVHPLWPGSKKPKTKHGLKDATRDANKVGKWWTWWKKSNVAVRTGAESGIVVVDVDTKNGQPGLATLARLEEEHGRLETLRSRTPSGGLHLFFRAPARMVANRTAVLPGIDVRGQDGYVVVAPSVVGGKEYRWENPGTRIAEMPEWLVAAVTAPKQKERKGTEPAQRLTYAEALRGVQEGSRNDTLFRFACRLRLDGFEYDEVLHLAKMAAAGYDPPLPEEETERCVESAWRYDPPLAVSEAGNAERFVARCAGMVRYVQEQDRWLVWDRHCWGANSRALFRMAKGTIRSLRDEAKATADPALRRLLLSHARRSEKEEGLRRMLALAGAELSVRAEDLDRAGLVAFANGVLDRASGTLRPGRREDLLTRHAPFAYDSADPRCQDWLARQGTPRARQPGGSAAATDTPARAKSAAAGDSWQERFDRWLAERCELGIDFSAKAQPLRADFSAWAGAAVSEKRFGQLVRAKGFGVQKSSTFGYEGFRLRP